MPPDGVADRLASRAHEERLHLRSRGVELEFRVLGRLTLIRSGAEVDLGGRLQRLVLAVLIREAGRAIPAVRLVNEIWGSETPATGTGPLRTYIWALRRLLDGETGEHKSRRARRVGVLASSDATYMLQVDQHQIDRARFEQHLGAARAAAAAGATSQALTCLDRALNLSRGPAFGDLAVEPALAAEALRLDQLVLGAKELRAELLLAEGRNAEGIEELVALARDNPEHERLSAMLMTALYRSGRQSEALRYFQQMRARLIEHVGIEPGPELRQLEQAILRQDSALDQHRPRS